MKRTPLVRKTPLVNRSQMRRGRAPRPFSPKKKEGVTDGVAQAVIRRSGGICERCKVKPGTQLHHRVTKGKARGGPHDEFNLCHLCHECHHVHAHGQLEHPWYVRGYFLGGKYVGRDQDYHLHYNGCPPT